MAHSYELIFATQFDDGYWAGRGGTHRRVIGTDTPSLALEIGLAMVGEVVGESLWLSELLALEKTEHRPSVPSLDNGATWGRVIRKLGLSLSGLRFLYSDQIGLPDNPQGHRIVHIDECSSTPEIVGFFPWPTP